MVSKASFVICLLFLVTVFAADAQRENRRRTGRRKTTTENPPPVENEPEMEKNIQKLDSDIENLSKPTSIDISDPENLAATPSAKENTNNSQSGPPFIVPRGSRKPRPVTMRNNVQGRLRPTLPTFTRKNSGRINKAEKQDIKPKEDNGVDSAPSSTTIRPSRGGSRRRNGGTQAPSKFTDSSKLSPKSNSPQSTVSTEPTPKKRFGGSRRPRGGRRNTTTTPVSEKL